MPLIDNLYLGFVTALSLPRCQSLRSAGYIRLTEAWIAESAE